MLQPHLRPNFLAKRQAPQQTCGDCVAKFQVKRAAFSRSQFDVETQDPYAWFLPHHFRILRFLYSIKPIRMPPYL
jgi:hypothetical protein